MIEVFTVPISKAQFRTIPPKERAMVAGKSRKQKRGCCHTKLIPAARCLEGPLASGRRGGSPRPERFVSEDAERAAGCEMALDVERVVNGGMSGQEALS